jgi:hypothetical protein
MRYDKILLNHLIDLGGYATRNNLYSPTAKTLAGSMLMTNKYFNRFLKEHWVQKFEPIEFIRDSWRETFFGITKKGAGYIDRSEEWKRGIGRNKSPYNVFHESMVRDVALGFLRLYPDFTTIVSYDKVYKNKGNVIKPDLTLEINNENKRFVFLIEIERKKSNDFAKLEKYEKIFTDPKKFNLPDKFKVLIVYANFEYNCFLRPQEYNDNKEKIERNYNGLNSLIKKCSKLPDNRYRFLAFSDFYRLNEPIWTTPKGNKINLI